MCMLHWCVSNENMYVWVTEDKKVDSAEMTVRDLSHIAEAKATPFLLYLQLYVVNRPLWRGVEAGCQERQKTASAQSDQTAGGVRWGKSGNRVIGQTGETARRRAVHCSVNHSGELYDVTVTQRQVLGNPCKDSLFFIHWRLTWSLHIYRKITRAPFDLITLYWWLFVILVIWKA